MQHGLCLCYMLISRSYHHHSGLVARRPVFGCHPVRHKQASLVTETSWNIVWPDLSSSDPASDPSIHRYAVMCCSSLDGPKLTKL